MHDPKKKRKKQTQVQPHLKQKEGEKETKDSEREEKKGNLLLIRSFTFIGAINLPTRRESETSGRPGRPCSR